MNEHINGHNGLDDHTPSPTESFPPSNHKHPNNPVAHAEDMHGTNRPMEKGVTDTTFAPGTEKRLGIGRKLEWKLDARFSIFVSVNTSVMTRC